MTERKRYSIRERNIIRAAYELVSYCCPFPENSPAYRKWQTTKNEITAFKKDLLDSGERVPRQHFKFWLDQNTEWYP